MQGWTAWTSSPSASASATRPALPAARRVAPRHPLGGDAGRRPDGLPIQFVGGRARPTRTAGSRSPRPADDRQRRATSRARPRIVRLHPAHATQPRKAVGSVTTGIQHVEVAPGNALGAAALPLDGGGALRRPGRRTECSSSATRRSRCARGTSYRAHRRTRASPTRSGGGERAHLPRVRHARAGRRCASTRDSNKIDIGGLESSSGSSRSTTGTARADSARDVPLRRRPAHAPSRLPVDDPLPPRAVDTVELVRLELLDHPLTVTGGQRDRFGYEHMKLTQRRSIDDLDDVARRAASCRRAAPGRRRSGRRAGAASARRRGRAPPRPVLDARIGPHHPLAVVLVDVDRDAAERRTTRPSSCSSAGARSRSPAGRRPPPPSRRGAARSPRARRRRRAPAGRSRRTGRSRSRAAVVVLDPAACVSRSSSSVVHRWPLPADVLARVLADRARQPAARTGLRHRSGAARRSILLESSE